MAKRGASVIRRALLGGRREAVQDDEAVQDERARARAIRAPEPGPARAPGVGRETAAFQPVPDTPVPDGTPPAPPAPAPAPPAPASSGGPVTIVIGGGDAGDPGAATSDPADEGTDASDDGTVGDVGADAPGIAGGDAGSPGGDSGDSGDGPAAGDGPAGGDGAAGGGDASSGGDAAGYKRGGLVRDRAHMPDGAEPITAHEGEYVVNASAVKKYGAHVFEALNRGRAVIRAPRGARPVRMAGPQT
jgi:hypothetical protein